MGLTTGTILNGDRPFSWKGLPKRLRLVIGCVGVHFEEGVEAAIKRAADTWHERSGHDVFVTVQDNLCIVSHMALEAMRNIMVMRARECEATHLALIEDDALLTDPETFLKLVRHGKGIISPFYDQSAFVPDGDPKHVLNWPNYAPGQGLQPVEWTNRACVLFDCRVFDILGERPFVDVPMYSVESYHGLWFRRMGVEWWMDTDTSIKLLRYPSPPWELNMAKKRTPGDRPWEEMERISALFQKTAQRAKLLPAPVHPI